MTSCLRNSMEVDEAIKKISVCEEGGDDMNGEEKADGEGKDDTESTSSNSKVVSADQDILYVQDVGFNVKVSVPGLDQFTIQVSAMELVQEIHQLLMDREDTCQRTCFSLQLNGVTLDNFAELPRGSDFWVLRRAVALHAFLAPEASDGQLHLRPHSER